MHISANDLMFLECYRDSERRGDDWMVEQAIQVANSWLWQASVIDAVGYGALAHTIGG